MTFEVTNKCRRSFRFKPRLGLALVLLLVGLASGCGTTTQRLGTEQLLMSDAVDSAINKIDFSHLAKQKVYLDVKYIKTIRGLGFVNADYIVSSLRQQLTAARCEIYDKAEEADIVVEPRVGALGTDGHEVTYGLPQTGQFNSAAAAFGGTPLAPSLPEISLGRLDAQQGIAKIMVFAYDRKTRRPIWQSGVAKSESSSSNTWVLGAGPFQKGTIYKGTRFAGHPIGQESVHSAVDSTVPLTGQHLFPRGQKKGFRISDATPTVDSKKR